ncbi:kinase-like domain-containing protein [Rhizophagus clarus]|uniref:Kinase-like domain-containing protein n=1 Tax=Rhizophagus clarus TaxID=94130 RepID=A0A8H3LK80_9GLOM|nr:kinase-like domain-containing protein [Rhizophagus clarus]
MSTIQYDLVYAAYDRAHALANIYDNINKDHEFKKQTIFADKSLTKDEKSEVIKFLNEDYDYNKVLFNQGKRRICENCQQECLATLYCEYSDWIGGYYYEWDSKDKQLNRFGTCKVILKKLKNVESANRSWFDEAKSHLTIANKWPEIAHCYGLTKDPLDGSYMLVMMKYDTNLKEYLQQNNITWKERIGIANTLIGSLEVIVGKEYTFPSDIYSIAMLMWEISSGQPPFANYESDYNLAMDIVNGNRPKIISVFLKIFKKTNKLDKLSDFEIMSFYYASSKISTSKIYQFDDNLPEPRNATEEELEAYHSKAYSFNVPQNIEDVNKSSNSVSKINSILKGNSKTLSKVFQKLRIESKDNNQNWERETMKPQVKKQDSGDNNDEIYNNPNLHSEDQDELEIPDDGI